MTKSNKYLLIASSFVFVDLFLLNSDILYLYTLRKYFFVFSVLYITYYFSNLILHDCKNLFDINSLKIDAFKDKIITRSL